MFTLSLWIGAMRPKTLLAGASPVILGLAFALYQDHLDPVKAILTLLSVLSMQIAANLFNDYYDALHEVDLEDRLGPTRVTQKGLLAGKSVRNLGVIFLLVAFISGLWLTYSLPGPFLFLGLLSLLLAFAYTGGPFPLSHYALGELLAFTFFGPVAVSGTYFIQTETLSPIVAIYGMAPGFLSAAIMAINNFRDRKSDLKQGKHTLMNLLPEKRAKVVITLFLTLPLFIPLIDFLFYKGSPLTLLMITPLFSLSYKLSQQILISSPSKQWNQFLSQTAQYLFLYSLICFLAINLKRFF